MVAKWPYCSSSLSETRKDQTYVPIHGARCSFVSERKFVQKHTYAIMYRSGYKGIGNIHTSVPEADVWVMEDYSPSTTIEIQTSVGLEEIKRRSIFELCKYQAVSPWFELRMGKLTGCLGRCG